MSMYKLVHGEIVAGIGSYEDCLACMEWLESEGVNGAECRIVEC